jgi:hypothetical protein
MFSIRKTPGQARLAYRLLAEAAEAVEAVAVAEAAEDADEAAASVAAAAEVAAAPAVCRGALAAGARSEHFPIMMDVGRHDGSAGSGPSIHVFSQRRPWAAVHVMAGGSLT